MDDIFLSMRKMPNIDHRMFCEEYHALSVMISQERVVALDIYHFLNSLDMPLSISLKKALHRIHFILQDLIILYSAEKILNMWLTYPCRCDMCIPNIKKLSGFIA